MKRFVMSAILLLASVLQSATTAQLAALAMSTNIAFFVPIGFACGILCLSPVFVIGYVFIDGADNHWRKIDKMIEFFSVKRSANVNLDGKKG